MLNGFTSQFTKRVTTSPFGLRAMPPSEPKSILSIIGKIINQINTAIATLTCEPWPNSSLLMAATTSGSSLPMATPTTMQARTHTER